MPDLKQLGDGATLTRVSLGWYVCKDGRDEFGNLVTFYLTKRGTWEIDCSNGWFDTEVRAMEVFNKATMVKVRNTRINPDDRFWEDRIE